MTCIDCNSSQSVKFSTKAKIKAISIVDHFPIQSIRSKCGIRMSPSHVIKMKDHSIRGSSSIFDTNRLVFSPETRIRSEGDIKTLPYCSGVLMSNVAFKSRLPRVTVDKFSGPRINFSPYEKLYPTQDISFKVKDTDENFSFSVLNHILSEDGKELICQNQDHLSTEYDDITKFLDEGVFIGLYTQDGAVGEIVSEDTSNVFPLDVYNDSDLQYKFKVSKPFTSSKKTYFAIRAACPFQNYEERVPQKYRIYDIEFRDPNGGLIVKYDDIFVQGDNRFTTYISKPVINNLLLHSWDADFPLMGGSDNYTITFSVGIHCDDIDFGSRFTNLFRKNCIKPSSEFGLVQDTPFKHLKISALEIGSSGALGILQDNYVGLHLKQPLSKKEKRYFAPSQLLVNTFDNGIYPQSNTVWQSFPLEYDSYNTTLDGANIALSKLRSNSRYDYIQLISSSVQDSGRLILKFDNRYLKANYNYFKGGPFAPSFTGFPSANIAQGFHNDIMFDATDVKLEIIAKKFDENVPDFSIDVVGYSDDKILCRTSPVGGFLQNDPDTSYSISDIPDITGFKNNSLVISEGAISDDDDYYQKDISPFGDHYYVTDSPLINSTEFERYTIPLKIMYDPDKLGRQPKYSLNAFLDNLYIDICPLPVGAVISNIILTVEHNPSDGIELNITGSPSDKTMKSRPYALVPISSDKNYNTATQLSSIPHKFDNPSDLKINYSRRWRGVNNDVASGAFDVLAFANYDFEFHYPTHPFLNGYVDFSNNEQYEFMDEHGNLIGTLEGPAGDAISDRLYQNIGWRLSSDQLFSFAPETDYKSIAWTSNIYDAFDRALRIGDGDAYVNLGQTPLSSDGWAIFLRFTPDNVNPTNRIILSRSGGLSIGYDSQGRLYAEMDSYSITDQNAWTKYQYPLSILVTYNENNDETLKLYVDNELSDIYDPLLGSVSFAFEDILNQDLTIGSDLPMFLHEFGITNGSCNIVNGSIDRRLHQTSVEAFFRSHRMHFWQDGQTNYRSEQHTYIDDNVSKWHLGAFKICAFSSDFDYFTQRDGTKYLQHKLVHDGSEYAGTIPDILNLAGVSYHTQVENDFLRFDIADIPDENIDSFYGVPTRISKNIQRGYNFKEEAICVDTIVEHITTNNIVWDNGKIGPKFIVSLYAPILNNPERPSKDFGLINRSTHYLEPSGCYQKLISKFTFDDLVDKSEQWAIFDDEIYTQEFKDRYFSTEINDMFLQYDIVYPTGSAYTSKINVHSANVRLENTLGYLSELNNNLKLITSGEQYWVNNLDFSVSGYTLAQSPIMPLYVQAGFIDSSLVLFKNAVNIVSTNLVFGDSLFGANPSYLSFSVSGNYLADNRLPLILQPAYVLNDSLSMFSSGASVYSTNYVDLYVVGKDGYYDYEVNNKLSLSIYDSYSIPESQAAESLGLFTIANNFTPDSIDNNMPLYVNGYDPSILSTSGDLSLFTVNYQISSAFGNNRQSIKWTSEFTGSGVLLSDQEYLTVDGDDEIRGFAEDLVCYGLCNSDQVPCYETPVTFHGDVFYQDVCVDGGIFRPKNTYTNADAEYDGHFYGARKYSGLAPFYAYYITIEGVTGTDRAIDIPKQLIEIEYNKNEEDGVSNGMTLMDYNGIKILSSELNTEDGFGKSVASKNDLLAIGSPLKDITYTDPQGATSTLQDAGTVYIYRRDSRPIGNIWTQDEYKSGWELESTLVLPPALLKAYSILEDSTIIDDKYNLVLKRNRWFTGQDGRKFGHSVDVASTDLYKSLGEDSREIIVVGGPSSKFNITFDDTPPSPVNICVLMFLDKFEKITRVVNRSGRLVPIDYNEIYPVIIDKDTIFDYFGSPRIRFNIHIMLFITTGDDVNAKDITWGDAPQDDPLHIHVYELPRNNPEFTQSENDKRISDKMETSFSEVFPTEESLPKLIGYYVDSSDSFEGAISDNVITTFINNHTVTNGETIAHAKEFFSDNDIQRENWILLSTGIIDDLLDTQKLIQTQLDLLGVTIISEPDAGDTRSNYNIPPDSGGRAYIFEKESGSWNLIQEIRSSDLSYGYPNQFGHSVSISDNTEVVAVGSPYTNQAVSIYEYRPEQRQSYYNELPDWVRNKRSVDYWQELREFSENNDIEKLYLSLSQNDKFLSRVELGINEYEMISSMTMDSVRPIGSWDLVANNFAPIPRLGYSLDVNHDGNMIVVGAPTDSLNKYNDADVYYVRNGKIPEAVSYCGVTDYSAGYPTGSIKSSWASSVNAGAIYVLESRQYYPHDTVMEYGRFGNLHRLLNEQDEDSLDIGNFDEMENIFYDKNFIRTAQDDNKIPRNVGLLFIITPEDDVLSNELTQNIIDWLALGDRNLVLVANDPVWENRGAYKKSNDVLNKLLRRLNSRMQIMPTKTRIESLPDGYSDFDNINVCHMPAGTNSTYINRLPLRGSGIADIRMYYGDNSGFYATQSCAEVASCLTQEPYQLQDKCELPLAHGGDLRAEWEAKCCTVDAKDLIYMVNWAFTYGSYSPSCGDQPDSPPNPLANHEPIPLLTAIEKVDLHVDVPAVDATIARRAIRGDLNTSDITYKFFDPPQPVFQELGEGTTTTTTLPPFIWDNDHLERISVSNYILTQSNSRFFDPEGRSILAAKAKLKIQDIESNEKITLDTKSRFCVSETLPNNSVVVLVAGVGLETEFALDGTTGVNDYDSNIKFYRELLRHQGTAKNGAYYNNLAQLSLWSEDSETFIPRSFKDAYDKSIIGDILKRYIKLKQGVSIDQLLTGIENTVFDIAWIANLAEYDDISNETINGIKYWLNSGNKKLIVTFDNYVFEEEIAIKMARVSRLCSKLGLSIKPWDYQGIYTNKYLNYNAVGIDYKSNEYALSLSAGIGSYHPIYPGNNGDNIRTITYEDSPLLQDVVVLKENNYWYMNAGVIKASFNNVEANKGYRIFVTTERYGDNVNVPISLNIGNAVSLAGKVGSLAQNYLDITNYDNTNETVLEDIAGDFIPYSLNGNTTVVDVQVGEGQNSIDLYLSANYGKVSAASTSLTPQTVRLIGISGIPIPIKEQIVNTFTPGGGDIIGYEEYIIKPAQEAYSYDTTYLRPISHDNTKYCNDLCLEEGLGGTFIEDGPVVAAQELEFITEFKAGYKRSRITVLTDPSMIQGRYIKENGLVRPEVSSFIKSLYPETAFDSDTYGRQFGIVNKLISPERGSPTKYLHSAPSLTGLNANFNSNLVLNTGIDHFSAESTYNPDLIIRPDVPWSCEEDESGILKVKQAVLKYFQQQISPYGSYCRFSGVINGISHTDATFNTNGMPSIMTTEGYDYLDFDHFNGGYPGDLFGYSVAIKDGVILAGSPFNGFGSGESINSWTTDTKMHLGEDGGGGSVYMFEKNNQSVWNCTRKFRPESLMGQLSGVGVYSDQFGHSVAMSEDVLSIGAPGHDYGIYHDITDASGAFVRKSFNSQFNITKPVVHDLGLLSSRQELGLTDIYGTNTGAIYTYENSIEDWENKLKDWVLVSKMTSDTNIEGVNGEKFGKSIYLSRPRRTDSDYLLVAGCDTSSPNGTVYTKDMMLRHSKPSTKNDDTQIHARLTGHKFSEYEDILLSFTNEGNNLSHIVSGIIRANKNGEIILEVSGQDPSKYGFIQHRPYIKSILGSYKFGTFIDGSMPLHVDGMLPPPSSNIDLFIAVENSGYVYNTLGLYQNGVLGVNNQELYLYSKVLPDPTETTSDYLEISISGVSGVVGTLNLNNRGN